MANPEFFKKTFDEFAVDGCIGDPNGELAYGYLRVSSSGQAEEGRSGLPRQIQHIHEIALVKGFKVPWELVFADDDTGFEFEQRPELSNLRREFRTTNRKSNTVIIEYLDRLSRNADWHQGYLLDEMKKYNIEPVFWKSFGSRIERTVQGAISQDGMEQSLQRMAEGTLIKAKSGRVTAKVPAFGYKLVDSFGNEGATAKKDTHYAINPDEAPIVKYIYECVVFRGMSLRSIASDLENLYSPPKKSAHWEQKLLAIIIRNPVYKGEFVANRKKEIKVWVQDKTRLDAPGKFVKRRVERPKEEWIIVPVPAIVSPELWEIANKMLDKNIMTGRRNAKEPFLLTGMVKCATCSYTFIGGRKTAKKPSGKQYRLSYYRCSARHSRMPHVIEKINCDQSQVSCQILDNAVWSALVDVLSNPKILIDVLDRQFKGEGNEHLNNQIEYLENQIREADIEDKKLYKAYMADVFDEEEYAEKRKSLKERVKLLNEEKQKLQAQTMTIEKYDDKKRNILALCQSAKESGIANDAPFEVKQRIIKTVVDKITLNTNENWFELKGVINGRFSLIERNPTGRGSSRLPVGSWRGR